MSAPCEHGMPSPASCTECMYEHGFEPSPKPVAQKWIEARYAGYCATCDGPIEVGDRIGGIDGVWHCARCVR